MPQLITISNPCPKCRAEFEAQRTDYCREFLRYQRENYALRAEFNEDRKKRDQEILRHQTQVNALWTSNKALEAELKHALEKLLRAERELIQAWKVTRPWVGLEIEEVQDSYNSDYQAQTRAVEAKLKERNNYPPQQQAEPVAKLFGSLPVYDTTQEAPKCSQA